MSSYSYFGKKERAQGMVEFALVIPIVLLLILGIVEFGRMMFVYSAVVTASREAVRYGSAAGENPSGVPRYMDCDGMKEAAKRLGSIAGIQGHDVVIEYNVVDGTDDCPPASADEITSDGSARIFVSVSALYQPIVPIINIPGFTISTESARTIVKNIQLR
jgi:hypothetical protein